MIRMLLLLLPLLSGCEKEASPAGAGSGGDADSDADAVLPCEGAGDGIKLVFAGDLMLGGKVGASVAGEGGGNYDFLFDEVRDCLGKADLLFANLESVPSLAGEPVAANENAVVYRADPRALDSVAKAGFGIVSLANDHFFDYGRTAMEDAFKNLDRAGIRYVGGGRNLADAESPALFEIKGRKIAFLAFTAVGNKASEAKRSGAADSLSGVSWVSVKAIEDGIYKARELADLVIVSMHFGVEYEPLPKSDPQDEFAHLAIERGADLVIGHHAHVAQPVMVYTGKHIAYSLGTFLSDETKENANRGFLLEVTILKSGKIGQVYRRRLTVNGRYQPMFD